MKLVGIIAVFLGGLVVGYLSLSLGLVDKVDGIPGAQEEPMLSLPTYLSFLNVMMAAITVVLAAVAIGIGFVAAYTFKELKEEARAASKEIAEKVSKEVSADALSEIRVKEIVLDLYAKAEESRRPDKWPNDPSDNEER